MKPLRRILVCLPLPKLGDFLTATPMLAALREACKDVHITLLLQGPAHCDWIELHPLIDAVLWDTEPAKGKTLPGTLRMISRLRAQKFDAVLYLRDRAHYIWVFYWAGIPLRIAQTCKYARHLLSVGTKQDREEPHQHEVEYNYDLLKPLGISGVPGPLVLPLSADATREANALLSRCGLRPGEPLIVVNPTFGGTSRTWPTTRFAQVCRALVSETELRVAIVGGAEFAESNAALVAQIGAKAVDLTGKTSVPVLAAILRQSALHLSVDTGTMHLAAATQTPSVVIFPFMEHWDQRKRWVPWQTEFRALGPQAQCSNCRPGNCPRTEQVCMDSITTDAVVGAACSLLSGQPRSLTPRSDLKTSDV